MRRFKRKINLVKSVTADRLREQHEDYYEDWSRRHEEAMEHSEFEEPDCQDYWHDPELYG